MAPPRASLLASLRSPLFLMCAALIVCAALGLRPAIVYIGERYTKRSIALRRLLSEFDVSKLRSFQQVLEHRADAILVPEDIETDMATWLDFETKDGTHPPLRLSLFVTYYSNPRDQVPHTPDVCYRQGGCTVVDLHTTELKVPGAGTDENSITVRVVDVQRHGRHRVIVYVFCANGEFCWDREAVRWIIGRPGDRYIYFSKIEATMPYMDVGQKPRAIEACKQLLHEALPVLLQDHFPTKAEVRGP